MSKTVHTWSTPDPDEYDPADADDRATKFVCTPETPWSCSVGVEQVFHPHMVVHGIDYVCTVCWTRTYRETTYG